MCYFVVCLELNLLFVTVDSRLAEDKKAVFACYETMLLTLTLRLQEMTFCPRQRLKLLRN